MWSINFKISNYRIYNHANIFLTDSSHMHNSLVLVRHVRIAPLSRIYLTTSASSGARKSFRSLDPVVLGIPLTQKHSLQENGTPRRGAFFSEYFSGKVDELSSLSTFSACFYLLNKYFISIGFSKDFYYIFKGVFI